MKPTQWKKKHKQKKTGRGLGSSVSLSAVGVLLMLIIPWLVYQRGAGAAWIAVGSLGGVLLVWQLCSYRLMRYSLLQGNIYTLAGFFGRRYKERIPVMQTIFALFTGGLLILAAGGLLYGIGDFVEAVYGIKSIYIIIGTPLLCFGLSWVLGRGGLRLADRWIAILVLAALVLINLSILRLLSGEGVLRNIFHSWASGSVSEYVNVQYMSGRNVTASEYISMISYGLIILGSPLVLQRFQQAENGKTVHRSRRWAVIFSLLALFCSIFAGGMLRAALYPSRITNAKELFYAIAHEVPTRGIVFYTTCLLFLVAAILVFYDLVHSCILHAAMIFRDDLFRSVVESVQRSSRKKKKGNKKSGAVRRKDCSLELTVLLVALASGTLAWYVGENLLSILKEVLIIVPSGLAPAVLLSLHDRRMNVAGTLSAFFGGVCAAVFWDLIPVIARGQGHITLQEFIGVHAVPAAMAFGLLLGWVVSRLTPKPSEEIGEAFDQVKYRYVTSDED